MTNQLSVFSRAVKHLWILKRKLQGRLEIRNLFFHVEKSRTSEIFSTLEDKFRISARPCNILYLFCFCFVFLSNNSWSKADKFWNFTISFGVKHRGLQPRKGSSHYARTISALSRTILSFCRTTLKSRKATNKETDANKEKPSREGLV